MKTMNKDSENQELHEFAKDIQIQEEDKEMIDLNGCYTKATQETYDKLVKLGCKETHNMRVGDWEWLFIVRNRIVACDGETIISNLKQIYLVNNEFTDKEPQTKGEESDKFHVEEVTENTISIEDKKKANFAKYGFEFPAFEAEILKQVQNYYIGYSFNEDSETVEPICWNKDGMAFSTFGVKGLMDKKIEYFNLTPISKQWYENEDNFPAMITRGKDMKEISSVANGDFFKSRLEPHGWRLASKEEKCSLYCEGD